MVRPFEERSAKIVLKPFQDFAESGLGYVHDLAGFRYTPVPGDGKEGFDLLKSDSVVHGSFSVSFR